MTFRQCRAFFKELDVNGDGRLDIMEFTSMVQAMGLKLSVADIKAAFNKADGDKNGSISFKEFVNYYTMEYMPQSTASREKGTESTRSTQKHIAEAQGSIKMGHKPKTDIEKEKRISECRKYFLQLDIDGNGTLDMEEFSRMLEHLGLDVDSKRIKKAFGNVDKNDDGEISFKEFCDYYNILQKGQR